MRNNPNIPLPMDIVFTEWGIGRDSKALSSSSLWATGVYLVDIGESGTDASLVPHMIENTCGAHQSRTTNSICFRQNHGSNGLRLPGYATRV